MGRELSSGMEAAVSAAITAPGFLLEIGFSTPMRLCTRGTISVMGNEWLAWNFQVGGIGVDATSGAQSGNLNIANTDLTLSQLILAEGIADKYVHLWKFYGEEPQDEDPILLFDGVGAKVDIDSNSNMIRVSLRQERDEVQFAPDRFITIEQGFSILPPAGTIIVLNNQSYILEPEKY